MGGGGEGGGGEVMPATNMCSNFGGKWDSPLKPKLTGVRKLLVHSTLLQHSFKEGNCVPSTAAAFFQGKYLCTQHCCSILSLKIQANRCQEGTCVFSTVHHSLTTLNQS